jgi:hypothetical protein
VPCEQTLASFYDFLLVETVTHVRMTVYKLVRNEKGGVSVYFSLTEAEENHYNNLRISWFQDNKLGSTKCKSTPLWR